MRQTPLIAAPSRPIFQVTCQAPSTDGAFFVTDGPRNSSLPKFSWLLRSVELQGFCGFLWVSGQLGWFGKMFFLGLCFNVGVLFALTLAEAISAT